MYQPIKLPEPKKDFSENFNLSIDEPEVTSIFTEAMFIDGRKTLEPIVQEFQAIKDLLETSIRKSGSDFSPKAYVQNLSFKGLEDKLRDVFGFRNIEIYGWNERYSKLDDDFETRQLNCYTYCTWRYPIDGLVTEKGFYDSTHSINTEIQFSLGAIRTYSAEELTGVFLHEFGHNIDPALVDINYTKVNALSKYLTDRKGAVNRAEARLTKNMSEDGMSLVITLVVVGVMMLPMLIKAIARKFRDMLFTEDKALAMIRDKLKRDRDQFNRYYNAEAFADNFARMYGFGAANVSALEKSQRNISDKYSSRFEKEKRRQRAIADMMARSITDDHRTDIHRVHAIIREYKADLQDPSIPARVKKDIQTDLQEVELLLQKYLNDYSDFENKINKLILEELQAKDARLEKRATTSSTVPVAPDNVTTERTGDLLSTEIYNEGWKETLSKVKDFVVRKVSAKTFSKNQKNLQRMHMMLVKPSHAVPIAGTNMVIVPTNLTKTESIELGIEDDSDYFTEGVFSVSNRQIQKALAKFSRDKGVKIINVRANSNVGQFLISYGSIAMIKISDSEINEIKNTGDIAKLDGFGTSTPSTPYIVVCIQTLLTILANNDIKSDEDINTILSHEYGHILSLNSIDDNVWAEYFVKVQLMQGISSIESSSDRNIRLILNAVYYHFEPEALANQKGRVNFQDMLRILVGSEAPPNWRSHSISGLLSYQIPKQLIEIFKNKVMKGKQLDDEETLEFIKNSQNAYKLFCKNVRTLSATLQMIDVEKEKLKSRLKSQGKNISESTGDNFVESKTNTAADKEKERSLTPDERKIANARYGKIECSIMYHPDKGYRARTHRASTDYYETLEKLPKDKVKFISSTS